MSHRRERITVKKKTEEKGVLGKALQQQERERLRRDLGSVLLMKKTKCFVTGIVQEGKKDWVTLRSVLKSAANSLLCRPLL